MSNYIEQAPVMHESSARGWPKAGISDETAGRAFQRAKSPLSVAESTPSFIVTSGEDIVAQVFERPDQGLSDKDRMAEMWSRARLLALAPKMHAVLTLIANQTLSNERSADQTIEFIHSQAMQVLDQSQGLSVGERVAVEPVNEAGKSQGKLTNYIEHPPAFFDSTGVLRSWETADPLPSDWTGIAKRKETLFVIGKEGAEMSYTALQAETMADARDEISQRKLSKYIEQAPVVLTVTPDELGIVQAAVQEYRELIASPTPADREARGNVWADREVAASDALLAGKLAVAARRFQTSNEVSNYTGLTQDVLNALASEHRMTPGAISVSSDGTKSVVLERDDVDDLYCQAILTVHSSGAVACHTGLYRERAIINNGLVTEPSVEVAIANASAVFGDLIVRHAEVRKEENYQSPGM